MRRPLHSLFDVLKTFPFERKENLVESTMPGSLKESFTVKVTHKCALYSGNANAAEEGGADGGSSNITELSAMQQKSEAVKTVKPG